jgi:hypothetical protein
LSPGQSCLALLGQRIARSNLLFGADDTVARGSLFGAGALNSPARGRRLESSAPSVQLL